jgi:hypothetical protein
MIETIPTGVSSTQEESIRPFPCKETIRVVISDDKISCFNRMGKTVIDISFTLEHVCNL